MLEPVAPPEIKELAARLPRTFGPALNDQLKQWTLLFPAEQRRLKAQLEWLSRLSPDEFKRLFAPVVEIESRMELPRWTSSTAGLTIEDTGILARSPYYPQWRTEVEKVFSHIDDGVEGSGALPGPPRLLLCVLPSGVPLAAQPLWPELAKQGTWVSLEKPFGSMLSQLASSLAQRELPAGLEAIESTWVFECDSRLSSLAEFSRATVLCWTALAAIRREFLNRLNTIQRSLRAVDQANAELKRMEISRLLGRRIGAQPQLREFVRSLLLSGNGSLVFSNSFIEWGASEALRRVQPQALLACFGIRPKLKPFSSMVLFEDQSRSNPVPEEDDPAGSLVDASMLSQYVSLAAQRHAARQIRSLTLMAACDLDRVLILGPRAPVPASGRFTPEEFTTFALRWLAPDP